MKKNVLLIVTVFLCSSAFSQHQADKWFFGTNAGLDFTGGSPVVLTGGQINTSTGTSVMSDTSGALLFYTDGMTVWDSSHQVMPNGTGLLGGFATQAALIVPKPGSDSLYYIFTLDAAGGSNGFRYSVVDMSLNSGLGDVDTSEKNVFIADSVAEKLTAVRQADNENNYWIVVHGWGTDAFYVYALDSSGLSAPVISHAGIVYPDNLISSAFGQMKFDPCGYKLAAAGYLDTVEVFNFDWDLGIVSSPVTIPMPDHTYGVEFSYDGEKLYVSSNEADSTLVQFDLLAGNTAAIAASRTVLSGTPDIRGLQIGNDQKIYVAKSFNQWLGVINSPTGSGIAANYVDTGINLDPTFSGLYAAGLTLPNFVQSYFRPFNSCQITGIAEANANKSGLLYPNPSTNEFTVHFSSGDIPSEILIYDQAGKIVSQHFPSSQEINFSFGKLLAPGIYFVQTKSKTGSFISKAVKLK